MLDLAIALLILLLPFTSLSGTGPDSLWLTIFTAGFLETRLEGAGGMRVQDFHDLLPQWADHLADLDGSALQEAGLQYAQEHGVKYLVTGTVERKGPRITITPQVITIASGDTVVLAPRQGDLADLFKVEEAVAAEIAQQLHVILRAPLPAQNEPKGLKAIEVTVHRDLSVFFAERSDSELALQEAQAAASLDPADQGNALLVASAAYRLARFDEAARVLQNLIKSQPGQVQAHVALANVYRAQDKREDALVECREVLKLDPANLQIQLLLGELLADTGDVPGAIAAYEDFLKRAPDVPQEQPFREKAQAALLSLRKRLR